MGWCNVVKLDKLNIPVEEILKRLGRVRPLRFLQKIS